MVTGWAVFGAGMVIYLAVFAIGVFIGRLSRLIPDEIYSEEEKCEDVVRNIDYACIHCGSCDCLCWCGGCPAVREGVSG
jgi:hypothetical protein